MIPQFVDLGIKNFLDAQKIHEDFLSRRKSNLCPDTVIIFRTYPVITLGRSSNHKDILVEKEVIERENLSIIKTNRGGGVTIHVPGQLVIYPVVNLADFNRDISAFLLFLEDWIISFLALYGVKAERKGRLSGVWAGNKKICFIGIGISRWVSFHGLSLNINPDLKYFSYINPCGMKGIEVTSLYQEIGTVPDESNLKEDLEVSYARLLENKGYSYADKC
ncbi:MAG: lipoyl(octanoyl) transferase LipB [Candidatus Omnitrophica bacterium]|nr:lipoyl(octanoyl) transferase LipB [Candidatus Omnitrophota bacterium]